jgi:hypothetical protein
VNINRIQIGHSNNSSSSHSIIFGSKDAAIPFEGNDYNQDVFHLTSVKDKMDYMIAQVGVNLHVQEEFIDPILASLFGRRISDPGTVDHQSIMSFPYRHGHISLREGNENKKGELHIEFLKELTDYIIYNPKVSIFGDNEPKTGDQIFREIQHNYGGAELIARKDGDWWTLYNPESGSRIRFSFKENIPPYKHSRAPELVDLKITDYCTHGCPFCYMGSTTHGKHADCSDMSNIAYRLAELGVFEVAIGGGEPTQHPDFVHILETFYRVGITPNFTTFNLDFVTRPTMLAAVQKYVGSLAVSDISPANLQAISRFMANQAHDSFPKITLQIPLGGYPLDKIREAIAWADDTYVPFTLLGYKHQGRGKAVTPHPYGDILAFLQEKQITSFGADSLFVDEFRGELMQYGVLPQLMVAGEGLFSMYVDAVRKAFGPSSCIDPGKLTPVSSWHQLDTEILKHFPYVSGR